MPATVHPSLNSPFKLTVSFTRSCNLDCALCYADCSRVPPDDELDADEWLRFLQEVYDEGVLQLMFEGGEVFSRRDDFLRILQWCGPRFFTRFRTNGTLVDASLARHVARCNVAGVMVDFLGAAADTHDDLTGVRGSFEKACSAVTHLIGAGVETEMLMILNRRNMQEVELFCDLANRLKVPMISVLRLYPIGRAKQVWKDYSLSIDEMSSIIACCEQRKALKRPPQINHSWHPANGNTCWQMAAVNARGDSIGCAYLREFVNFGNIRTVSLTETWQDPLYQQLRSGAVEGHCTECERNHGTRGGCRATAYAFHGRWDAKDPYCRVSNEGVDLRELPDWMLSPQPRSPDEIPPGNR